MRAHLCLRPSPAPLLASSRPCPRTPRPPSTQQAVPASCSARREVQAAPPRRSPRAPPTATRRALSARAARCRAAHRSATRLTTRSTSSIASRHARSMPPTPRNPRFSRHSSATFDTQLSKKTSSTTRSRRRCAQRPTSPQSDTSASCFCTFCAGSLSSTPSAAGPQKSPSTIPSSRTRASISQIPSRCATPSMHFRMPHPSILPQTPREGPSLQTQATQPRARRCSRPHSRSRRSEHQLRPRATRQATAADQADREAQPDLCQAMRHQASLIRAHRWQQHRARRSILRRSRAAPLNMPYPQQHRCSRLRRSRHLHISSSIRHRRSQSPWLCLRLHSIPRAAQRGTTVPRTTTTRTRSRPCGNMIPVCLDSLSRSLLRHRPRKSAQTTRQQHHRTAATQCGPL
eukprot:comp21755_c0_seq1/m.48621 comp21755_c0_seq1/g.48621  ORF comp21755_c0_seq1/g.48621 comp21755_c0_seq1/m.48621 type:complete len:403 (+) comp21755_c0_seq1:1232-2440(+)